MNTLDQIAHTIESNALLRPEQKVLTAVSGGADSLCLAWALRQLGYRVMIAHYNHGLRPESEQEAAMVGELAERWQVPFFSQTADQPPRKGSLEAWARAARYQFLFRIATKESVRTVASGHTADDQVETILMNLLRGAGPGGLAGMAYQSPLPVQDETEHGIRLIRPLLGLWREQTEACCRQAGLQPVHDASNRDLAFTRNRIRHQLLPALAGFNPAVKETLLRTGRFMEAVSDWMQFEVERAWPQVAAEVSEGSIRLELDAFRQLPKALGLSLIRYAHDQLSSSQAELSLEQTQSALKAIREQPRGYQMSLPGGLILELQGERALLSRDPAQVWRQLAPQCSQPRSLNANGVTALDSGWHIRATLAQPDARLFTAIESGAAPFGGPHSEAIGLQDAFDDLQLRPPHPGDIFQPLGMTGRLKLADFFINERIPHAQRARWPLLVAGDEILWVVGLRLSEAARVRPEHQQILRLELVGPDGD